MTPPVATAEHTDSLVAKAPWFVSGTRTRHNSMPVLQIISEPTGDVLALVPYSDRTPKAHAECYADARLIAAAPDLLAVLKSVRETLRLMGDYPTMRRCIEAAVAKAEGRQS